MIRSLIAAALFLGLAACSSAAAVGEACDTAGALTEECADGAVCTPEGTSFVCLKICTEQTDCAATEACNGLTGNVKSCQPK